MEYDQVDFLKQWKLWHETLALKCQGKKAKPQRANNRSMGSYWIAWKPRANFINTQLRNHPAKSSAVNYLKSRGLSGEIARDFAIGFAPSGWDNLLSAIGTDAEKQQSLLRAGMIIERSTDKIKEKSQDKSADGNAQDNKEQNRNFYDRFRDRIMFPIRDSRGRTVAFGGRVLGDDKRSISILLRQQFFIKAPELYGLYESKKSGEKFSRILLVEGYMDVIALAQMGVRNAVATLGTATSERHLTRLFRAYSEVIFCFDGDQPGRTAAWRALETTLPLMEDGRQVRFLFLPEGSDPDTYIREVGKEKFTEALDNSPTA